MNYSFFISESVSEGHPDKICDQISDTIVDEAIKAYPKSRIAVETMVTANHTVLAGEVSCPVKLDYENLARQVIRSLDYKHKRYNFHHHSPVTVLIHQQSPDIAVGVDKGGAGDQGMMFGYATDETPELMPLPIILAHRLIERIDKVRKRKIIPYLRPDGKSEVKVRYKMSKPIAVDQVILAVPHDPRIGNSELKEELYKKVVIPVLDSYGYKIKKNQLIVNGTGKWEIGGPFADTGVTGRKIVVDTYGGMARNGGGCFSGKDPTKVDRSSAYACRYIAKNIVAHQLALRCEVHLAYVIGHKEPIAKAIDTFGTELVDKQKIERFAWDLLDLSVWGIINELDLLQPIYRKSACYGHFGRDGFPWEKIVH